MSQLIFLGAPGSGKGTQAKRLAAQRGYEHISTGDLLRREVEGGSELGQRIAKILKRGELVDDLIVLEMLQNNCQLEQRDYIFDGFPRNIQQAKLLQEKLLGDTPHWGVYFNIPAERLVERLVNRRSCTECGASYNLLSMPPARPGACDQCGPGTLQHRTDDQEDIIRKRMVVYNDNIWPVLEYYKARGLLLEVAADREADEVFEHLLQALS